jgi:hypothetical protein
MLTPYDCAVQTAERRQASDQAMAQLARAVAFEDIVADAVLRGDCDDLFIAIALFTSDGEELFQV